MKSNMSTNYVLAEIDHSAIIHNCKIFRSLIPAGCKLCAAVKCNAFGHGIKEVLPALKDAEVEMLCVASIREAQELKEFGWILPILLLGSEFSIYHDSNKKDIACWLVENQIRITATRLEDIEHLSEAAELCSKQAVIHLMLDSGMNRMGVNEKPLLELINYTEKKKNIKIEGLYTHLASADEYDKGYALLQLERFNNFLNVLKDKDYKIPIIHAANSAAIIDLPQSHFNMVRPGISLYGYSPGQSMHRNNFVCFTIFVSISVQVKFTPSYSTAFIPG